MNFENIAKSNKPEEQMLRDSIYMKYLEWVNLYRQMVEIEVTKEGGLGSLTFFFYLFIIFGHIMRLVGSEFLPPPPTWQRKFRVLTTRPPGNS